MQITAYSVIKFKKYKLSKAKGWVRGSWTDARRPVPRLWIRSAEVRGGMSLGEWEHNNNKGRVGKEGGGD